MLIGIDSSPCSLSLRNRSTLSSTTKCHQNKSDLKNVFVQKFFFFQYLLFFQSQSCLLESTAAIFRQSAGYVCKILSVVRFLQPQDPRNLLYGLTIGYCIISKCNGMLFKIWTPRILAFFKNKTCNFFDIYCHHSGFSVLQKSLLGFDNKLLENLFWS